MKSLLLKIIVALVVLMVIVQISFASITVDSVSTVISSCSNNGTATVHARRIPSGVLLYAIVAGPVTSPLQNSNTFSSLYPGNYTARVYDANFDSTETQFQIDGNYQLPNFSLTTVDPTCPASTDGSITIIPDTNFGLQPFLYSMISPSVIAPQVSNYFSGLNANTYLMRVTDACGNYQTRTGVLANTGTKLIDNGFLFPSLVKTGCDTMVMTFYIYLLNEKASLPYTLTLNMATGTVNKTVYPIMINNTSYNPGLYQIVDTLINITYGDYLQVILTDVCGISVYSYVDQVAPFDFDVLFSPVNSNCVSAFGATILLKQLWSYPFHYTTPREPLSFTLTDISTNSVVDSMINVPLYAIYLKPETLGATYSLVVTDGCGQTWQQNIQWPAGVGAPYVQVNNSISLSCMDSTTVINFSCYNFQSPVTVHILSGPTNAHSTKPHYQYADTIIYPRNFMGIYSAYSLWIHDCPAGNYTFEVTDSCGNSVMGSYYIDPASVANLQYTWYIKPSCLNNNTLYYNFQQGTGYTYWAAIWNVTTGAVAAIPPLLYVLDSITTLPIGQYALVIDYGNNAGGGIGYDGSLISDTNKCWELHDTISIVPYTNNSFLTNNTIFCSGTNYVELIPDTSRGVPPYKFAIISGPQTFPLQDSGVFQIQQFGNYVISMEDVCGNNYTQQISITSDSFPPIVKNGFICEGNNASLTAISSAYFTYIWYYPNGTSVIGDSISFHPFTAADTGWYHVIKIVNINGCNDTLQSDYYLSGGDSVPQSFAICAGDSVTVGTNVYHLPGTYRDTLSTVFGCDSVLITTVTYAILTTDSNSLSICNGDSVAVGNNIYHTSGTYTDTLTLAGGCKKLIVTQLTVFSFRDSISAAICQGDSFIVGTFVHQQQGIFNDTLTSVSGCDSIVVATISFTPLAIDSNALTICNGDSVAVGTNFYSIVGTYVDTIPTTGNCKKIVVTQLSVTTIRDSVSAIICQGDSFIVGTNIHQLQGIFNDTLIAASGCDSIVVATICFTQLPIDSNALTICNGDSVAVATNFYTSVGTYVDTVPTTGNCKKIVVTQLSVSIIRDSVSATICQGDSFIVGTIIHQQQGIFNDTLTSVSGCDSIVVATISFTPLAIDSNDLTICNGDSVAVGTNFYTSVGTYVDTVSTTGNCKKIVVTQLSVTIIRDSVNAIICQGDSFMVGTIIHQQQGVFNDTLISVSGCDSIVVATISFTPLAIDSNALTICNGDSVAVGTNFYTSVGTYVDTVPISGNCKKIVITQLSNTTIIDSVSAAICQGDSFVVGNIIHQQQGIFNDTLISVSGCDSIVIATISFTQLAIDSNDLTICKGDSVGVGNNFYSSSGIYSDTITLAGGCKKIIITQLSITSIIDSVSAAICQGDSFVVGNIIHQQQGIFNDTLTSVYGCDSIVVATISFTQLAIDSNDLTICKGDSVGVGNNFYSSSGIYSDTITLAGGCKKIIITQLSITSIIDSVSATICQGDSFAVGNIIHQQQGIFNDTLTSVSGCDSIVVATISFTQLAIDSNDITICKGDSVGVGNNFYSSAGIYSDTITLAGGCKKIIITQLSITSIIDSVSAAICQGDSFMVGTIIHQQQGVFNDTLVSVLGCDSIVVLNLNWNTPPYISITTSADTVHAGDSIQLNCNNTQALNYYWYGNAIFSNQYSAKTTAIINVAQWIYLTITNADGCHSTDSIFIFIENDDGVTCDDAVLFIPNAFTPNADGINDYFKIIATNIQMKYLRIFNRWGEQIFESTNVNFGWDGNFKDLKCTGGVYYYVLQFESCLEKRKRYKYGSITLLN